MSIGKGIKAKRHKVSGHKIRTSHIVLKINVVGISVVFCVVLGEISNFWRQLEFITWEGMGK